MIDALKVFAHLVTCVGLCCFLKDELGLTGVKFWIPYILIGTVVCVINHLPS